MSGHPARRLTPLSKNPERATMERREEELVQRHAVHDEELKALYIEHQELKHRIEAFNSKLYLTPEDEMERKRLQKLKLASKDRMMELLNRHQNEAR
jgi:uncharacterized protein